MPKVARKIQPDNQRQALGRTPEAYKEWCRARVAAGKHRLAVTRSLEDDTHQHFATMTQFIHKMAYGSPLQQVQVEDTTPPTPLTGEAIVARLLAALPLLLAGHPNVTPRLSAQAALDAEFTVEDV